MLERTDVVILAGGKGTRLAAALPEGHPKALAAVAGRPFLAHLLEHLHRSGARRVVLALGYGSAQVEGFLARERLPADFEIATVVEPRPLGTGGGLRHALQQVRSDPFIAMNGDSLSDVDLEALLAFHGLRGAQITLALSRVDDAAAFGTVAVGADGRVREFAEKSSGRGGLVNAGVYVIGRAALNALAAHAELSFEREVLPGHVGRGLYGFHSSARFVDIGTPESLRRAAEFVRSLSQTAR